MTEIGTGFCLITLDLTKTTCRRSPSIARGFRDCRLVTGGDGQNSGTSRFTWQSVTGPR